MKRPRLLLADDHPMMLKAIQDLLEPDFEIVGTAQNGRQLLEQMEKLSPQLVVMDVSMPQLNGLEAAREIHRRRPEIRILFFTMRTSPEYVREAFLLGASGYVSKACAGTELIRAAHQILRGRQYLRLGAEAVESNMGKVTLTEKLTSRQRQVLQLVAEGMSGKVIASTLHISPKTVEFHKATMIRTLGMRSTADLIRYAVENGLVGAMGDSVFSSNVSSLSENRGSNSVHPFEEKRASSATAGYESERLEDEKTSASPAFSPQ